MLCRDNNDYVRNITNSDNKTKKRLKRTEKYGSIKYVMSETSYRPTEEETRDSVNIVRFTPQQQQNKTQDQLFLHVSNFMNDDIEILQKKLTRKTQIKKTSNCSTVPTKQLHVLLNLSIKTVMKIFQHLTPCRNTWKKKQ